MNNVGETVRWPVDEANKMVRFSLVHNYSLLNYQLLIINYLCCLKFYTECLL